MGVPHKEPMRARAGQQGPGRISLLGLGRVLRHPAPAASSSADAYFGHPPLENPMSFVRTLTIAAVVLTGATSLGAQTKRAFTLADWYKLTNVSAPAMSPDGSRIAFTVQTVNERDNKYHREVWVVSTAGGAPQRFTSPSTESSNPRWSPDGKVLLFTSQRPGGKGSTWMLRMDQPGGEAYQDDSYPRIGSVSADLRVSVWAEGDSLPSDSARRTDDPFSKMQPMARPPYGSITKPLDPAR